MNQETQVCEKCQTGTNNGNFFLFYFGKITNTEISTTHSGTVTNTRTTTHYQIGGKASTFLCDRCVIREDAKRRLGKAIKWGVFFLISLAIMITYIIWSGIFLGTVNLAGDLIVIAVIALPLFATGGNLFNELRISIPEFQALKEHNQDRLKALVQRCNNTGEELAINLKYTSFVKLGWNQVFTTETYEFLKKE